jgi:hypothetical protein
MLVDVRKNSLSLLFVLVLGCSRSGGDADPPPTTSAAGEAVAPVETEPANPEPAAADPDLCVPASYEEWATCEGKRVQVDGRAPKMIAQHPMIGGPEYEQSYLEIEGGGQIIVLTKQPVTCQGEMRVVGTLRGVGLGGEPGTKGSYENWTIEAAEVTCR